MYERITDEDPYHAPMRIYPSGSTTTSKPPSPACSPSARRTSPITAPTASVPVPSCRAWPTATTSSRTPSGRGWLPC
jgi:hypothetical protein